MSTASHEIDTPLEGAATRIMRAMARSTCRPLYAASLLLAAATVLTFPADLSLLRLTRDGVLGGDIGDLIRLSEVFAHGIGVALILLTVVVLHPVSRWKVPRIAVCAFGSGIAADAVKLLIGRMRPRDNEFGSVWETFHSFIPALSSGDFAAALESKFHSFPSAHVATSAGLAIGLSYFFPRGRWLFAFFAVLTALQRIEAGSHFFSDTLAGAAVACLIAGLCCDSRSWGRWFDRLEARGE